MTLIYIGILLMTFGDFIITFCLATGDYGFFYYMSLGFLPIGIGFLSSGITLVNAKLERFEAVERALNELICKMNIKGSDKYENKPR